MKVKVKMRTMQDARRMVSVAEQIPYEVDLLCGRYAFNAKSMLGVLSMPEFLDGELRVDTDDPAECEKIMSKLLELDLLAEADTIAQRSIYDITTFGEILIDFTKCGVNDDGMALFAQNPGGAPANVAVATSRLCAHTAFLGKAGKDMHGEYLKKVLQQDNVETKGLILDSNYFTTLAFVDVSETGERTFSFARKPGADTQMQKEEIDVDILDCTNIFHVGSLPLTDEPSRATTFYAVRRAKSKGSVISYDPNYRASLWKNETIAKDHMRSLVPLVDIMKIAEEEMRLLTDYDNAEEAARELFHQGVKIVAITLGSKGAYVYCKDGGKTVPAFDNKAVDTNGAGDSFWSGFLYQLSKSEKALDELGLDDLCEYAHFGNAVASLCVERKGAIPAMPTLEQVKERLIMKR